LDEWRPLREVRLRRGLGPQREGGLVGQVDFRLRGRRREQLLRCLDDQSLLRARPRPTGVWRSVLSRHIRSRHVAGEQQRQNSR
jgi:hypothetical protein